VHQVPSHFPAGKCTLTYCNLPKYLGLPMIARLRVPETNKNARNMVLGCLHKLWKSCPVPPVHVTTYIVLPQSRRQVHLISAAHQSKSFHQRPNKWFSHAVATYLLWSPKRLRGSQINDPRYTRRRTYVAPNTTLSRKHETMARRDRTRHHLNAQNPGHNHSSQCQKETMI
jgi:hypothetical protein